MAIRAISGGFGKVRHPGRLTGTGDGGGGGGGGVAQTWDPARKGTNVTLSGGNLIASLNGAQNRVSSTGSKTSGKWYWEILVGTQTAAQGFIGLGNGATAGTGPVAGEPCQYRDGSWNGLGGTPGAAWVAGDIIGFDFDFSTGIIRTYKNGVAGGTRTYGSWGSTTSYIMATDNWGFSGPYVFTIRTIASEFSYSVPSGFTAWGG